MSSRLPKEKFGDLPQMARFILTQAWQMQRLQSMSTLIFGQRLCVRTIKRNGTTLLD